MQKSRFIIHFEQHGPGGCYTDYCILVDFVVIFIISDYNSLGFFSYKGDKNKMLIDELSSNAAMILLNSYNDELLAIS